MYCVGIRIKGVQKKNVASDQAFVRLHIESKQTKRWLKKRFECLKKRRKKTGAGVLFFFCLMAEKQQEYFFRAFALYIETPRGKSKVGKSADARNRTTTRKKTLTERRMRARA